MNDDDFNDENYDENNDDEDDDDEYLDDDIDGVQSDEEDEGRWIDDEEEEDAEEEGDDDDFLTFDDDEDDFPDDNDEESDNDDEEDVDYFDDVINISELQAPVYPAPEELVFDDERTMTLKSKEREEQDREEKLYGKINRTTHELSVLFDDVNTHFGDKMSNFALEESKGDDMNTKFDDVERSMMEENWNNGNALAEVLRKLDQVGQRYSVFVCDIVNDVIL